jgi:hypothetical protein
MPTRTATACAGFEEAPAAVGAAACGDAGALAWLAPGDAADAGWAGGFGALFGAAAWLQAITSNASKHGGSWKRRGRSRERPWVVAGGESLAIALSFCRVAASTGLIIVVTPPECSGRA